MTSIRSHLKEYRETYPGQFWLMFLGMLISTIGASMIWPFLMIYVSKKLELPLTIVGSLLTINAIAQLIASFAAGPIIDRFGRKWMMVASLALNGIYFVFLSQADTYPAFALLLAIGGFVNPIYRIGADAMMADLVPPLKRPDAYALLRLSNNAGIALGPFIGGLLISTSYTLAFYCAAAGMIIYSLLLAFFARETMPSLTGQIHLTAAVREKWGGYPAILKDRFFVAFVLLFVLVTVCATLMWVMMPVYANSNFGIQEIAYSIIPITNALMVVLLQVPVTQLTKRFPTLSVVAIGAAFYALATGSVALAGSLVGFWGSMVIMTIGELVIVPTSSTFVANRAPADKRGRYMSLYGLSWGAASGLGALAGGFLNDTFGPVYIWYGGFIAGILAVIGFLYLARLEARHPGNEIQPVPLSD
jgi:MFS family permease